MTQDQSNGTDLAIGFDFQTERLEVHALYIGDILQLDDRSWGLRGLAKVNDIKYVISDCKTKSALFR